MTPIETTWRGWRFRSRTEARWAVFLTAAKIRFEYEPEGFALPSGWYLPDFWMPERNQWLEVKGQEPTTLEKLKAIDLVRASGARLIFAVGNPDPDIYEMRMVDGDGADMFTVFDGPLSAYAAARAKRFDGRTTPANRGSGHCVTMRVPRWY